VVELLRASVDFATLSTKGIEKLSDVAEEFVEAVCEAIEDVKKSDSKQSGSSASYSITLTDVERACEQLGMKGVKIDSDDKTTTSTTKGKRKKADNDNSNGNSSSTAKTKATTETTTKRRKMPKPPKMTKAEEEAALIEQEALFAAAAKQHRPINVSLVDGEGKTVDKSVATVSVKIDDDE